MVQMRQSRQRLKALQKPLTPTQGVPAFASGLLPQRDQPRHLSDLMRKTNVLPGSKSAPGKKFVDKI
jgi:hypothetical protein